MAVIVPNANAPVSNAAGRVGEEQAFLPCTITVEWHRNFASWVAQINANESAIGALLVPGMVMAFAGGAAPAGWVQDTTVGLPGLPGGYMWIKKT